MTERDAASAAGGSVDEPSAHVDDSSSTASSETAGESAVAGRRPQAERSAAGPVAVRPVRASLSGLREKIESTAALRESLDANEAEAQDLRASIEQLRQELDTERVALSTSSSGTATEEDVPAAPSPTTTDIPPPQTADPFAPAESSRRRLPWWVLTLIAVLVVLALLLFASRCGSDTSGSASPTTSPQVSSAPSASPTAQQSAAGAAAPSPTSMAWAGAQVSEPPGLPDAGPGITETGTFVTTTFDADGTSMDVYERVLLPSPRSEPLLLAVPTLPNLVHPSLADAQVQLDDTPVPVTGEAGVLTAELPPSGSFTSAVIRYRLADSVITQPDSKPGRVTALVLPLTADLSKASGSPVVVQTSQKGVVDMSCPVAVDQIAPPCASESTGGTWTATPPTNSLRTVVLLLIDR
jgi:hypothetical protein